MTRQKLWVAVPAALLGLWLVCSPRAGTAADDKVSKDVEESINKIADLLEKGKADDAKKEAADLVKKKEYDGGKVGGMKEPMHALSLRSKGGLGIGEKAGVIKPDGIEAKIMDLGKKKLTAAAMKDQADAIKRGAYITLAVAEITAAAVPKKNEGKKMIADWNKWTKEMQDAAKDLATAADKKNDKGVMDAAKNLDGSCTSCHQVFRPAS